MTVLQYQYLHHHHHHHHHPLCGTADSTHPVLPKWRSTHLSFPCRGRRKKKKNKHIGHLISCASAGFTPQPITSVYPRCHPSQSHLTGVRHPHPGCWVKKVGSSGVFVCAFTFSQLPPFSPLRALGVGRTAVIPAEQSRAEHPAQPPQPSHRTVALQQAESSWRENTFSLNSQEVNPSCIIRKMLLRRIR